MSASYLKLGINLPFRHPFKLPLSHTPTMSTPIKKLSSFDIVKRRHNTQPPSLHSVATDLEIVVDKSGSMSSMGDVPAEQIHKLIKDQRQLALDENRKITLSLTVFDNASNTVIDSLDLHDPNIEIPGFQDVKTMLTPGGLTRFYDTILDRVASQKARSKSTIKALPYSIRSLNPKINRVLYVLTDGEDNSSFMGMQKLRQCLNTQKALGFFTAVFLAANIGNAEVVGEQMGFDAETSLTIGNTPQFASVGMNHANSLLRAVSGGSAPPVFTQSMRQASYAPPTPSAAALAMGYDSNDGFSTNMPVGPPPQLLRQHNALTSTLRTSSHQGIGHLALAPNFIPPPTVPRQRYNLRARR